jgi:hypothetical protein
MQARQLARQQQRETAPSEDTWHEARPYEFVDRGGVTRKFRSQGDLDRYKAKNAQHTEESAMEFTKQAAVEKMAIYLDWAAKQRPESELLQKLAVQFRSKSNLVEALHATYPVASDEQVSKHACALVHCLHEHLQKLAMGPLQGVSNHPSSQIGSTGGGTGMRIAPTGSDMSGIKTGTVALLQTLGLREGSGGSFDKEAAGTAALASGAVSELGPYAGQQSADVAGGDSLIAAMERNRDEHPYHYWLNPAVPGPIAELVSRLRRRASASRAHSGLALGAGVGGNFASGFASGAGQALGLPIPDLNLGTIGNVAHGGTAQKDRARRGHEHTNEPYAEHEEDAAEVAREKESAHGGPFNTALGGSVTNQDARISGMERNREERPGHYWLNPFVAGPLRELWARYVRRASAGMYESPGMTALAPFTLGAAPAIAGGAGAKEDARAGHQEFASSYDEGPEDAAKLQARADRKRRIAESRKAVNKMGTWVTRNGKRVHVSCRGKTKKKKAALVALERMGKPEATR